MTLTAYDPAAETQATYVEDPDGIEFACHDLDDKRFWYDAHQADALIVRVVAQKGQTTPSEIKGLCHAVQSMIDAQQSSTRHGIRTPDPFDLAALRRDIRQKLHRRTLAGLAMNAAGDKKVLALCFVPEQTHGCSLTVTV